jgi:large subunit ribosomal protein L22
MVDMIRGRHVDDARRVLRFTPSGPSTTVGKVLESAVANAEHNRGLPGDELVVARAWVDEGPTLKRFRPRAQGRATRIRKRTCHISVVVGRAPEADRVLPERPAMKQTARRVRKDTASEATQAGPETTSETSTRKSTRKKSTAKKTTAKKTTAKKTTAKKTTAQKPAENDKEGS